MSIRIIETCDPLSEPGVIKLKECLRSGKLTAVGTSADIDVRGIVSKTIEGVRKDGDRRVIEDTAKLHGPRFTPDELRVPPEDIAKAYEQFERTDPGFLELASKVKDNIRQYQESILIKAPPAVKRHGRELSLRYTPIDRVGVYVPGGKAAYPSSVLTTVVPAQVAGVKDIVMISPPTEAGNIIPMVLALAYQLGIKEVYRVSGVAGLAAAAFGTDTIPPVDKIVGPGSAFITEAKRQLFGRVGIDITAGPSEVFIIADETANPAWVAADMLAQAEHDPGSAVLATPSAELADAVAKDIDEQLPELEREKAIRKAIEQYSLIAVTPHLAEACDLANAFAPEHLQIVVRNESQVLQLVRHAGAIFLGPHTPVPLGDYYAGPSHVLPTGGTARFFGPLSCNDFLVATSVVRYDAASLAADADDVIDFAKREGLTAHARAIEIRKKN